MDVMFLGRVVQIAADEGAFAAEDLVTMILRALVDSDLCAITINSWGDYLPIPSRLWRVGGRERLLDCMVIESEVLGLPLVSASITLRVHQEMIEGRHIYVTRASADSFLSSISAEPHRAKGPAPDELNRIKNAIRDVGVDAVKSIEHAVSLFGGKRTTTAQALREVREENQKGSE